MIIFFFIYKGGGYDVENGLKDHGAFENWLQCYQNPSMNNLQDRHKRTIWFEGEPGILVPKGNFKLNFVSLML
jgi:endonuclease VIII-like 1